MGRFWYVWLAAMLAAACSGRPAVPLEHAAPSAAAAAQTVLDAMAARDLAALRAIALNEQEFLEHVWPELPSARPERNLPFSYVWSDLKTKSDSALAGTLAAQGGRRYQLISVRFLGGTTQYRSYLVHRNTELTVRNAAGATELVHFFGSTFEKHGRFKIFSYVVD